MILAVTGASGFVGGHIVRTLMHKHTVHAYARRTLPHSKLYTFHNVDITKPFSLPKPCEVVIHAAAVSDLRATKQQAMEANYFGTIQVLKAAKKAGVKHFIYVSTASVYDVTKNKYRTSEDFAKVSKKNNWYSITKYQGEVLVTESGLNATLLRPHVVYGESDTSIMPGIFANARGNKLLVPIKSPKEISVTYIGNLCAIIEQVCTRLPKGVHTYNVADEAYITNIDFLTYLVTMTGTHSLQRVPVSLAVALSYAPGLLSVNAATIRQLNQHSSVSVQKLLQDGYTLPYTQQEGLERLAQWYSRTKSYKTHNGNTQDVWPDYLV